jgi:lysophospholipase L1-like esterase
MTLRAQSKTAGIELGCGECPFDRLVVFHSGTARLNAKAEDSHAFAFGTYWEFPKPVDTVALELRPQGAELYGLLLHESHRQGVLYHAIGVNGATFAHFNRAPLLLDQLPWLQPDLLIVSLGTNEALQPSFSAEQVAAQARQLILALRQATPGVPLLLITPPDALSRGRGPAQTGAMRDFLLELAETEQLACWDLYGIMGGPGSVRAWRELELAHTDLIHFTKAGYELQARLLLEALYKAYGDAH